MTTKAAYRSLTKFVTVLMTAVLLLGWAMPLSTSAGTAYAAPSETLRQGAKGDDVKTLQQALIDQGYLKGRADGVFGTATLAAVKAFQKAKGLTQDGAVGTATWNKLMEKTNATLKFGAQGTAVATLQKALIEKKYLTGSADGKFGNATLAAVKAFQKANGLTADGTVGAATWAKLNNSSSSGGSSSASGTRGTLRVGAQGDDVKTLQQKLANKGYLKGSADGKFGNGTLAAVKAFQKAMNVKQDGVVGPTTWALLMFSRTLRQGSSGDDVKELQTILKKLGYLSGTADGKFGAATKKAVIALQKARGLTADGVAGSNTFAKLYATSSAAKSSTTTSSSKASLSMGQQIVEYAKNFLGIPYVYGAESPSVGFDCSGLTWYVLKHFGISAPRSSTGYASAGTAVSSMADAQPGDILCFRNPVGHVGIYVGNGLYLHAPQTGEVVKIATLNRTPSYIRRFAK
ncbi:MAG: peptidoglycan-binding protein [Eubacteriales bacterium]|nr:peptidoglycan-binding protein [Eubacteriales bacterium]